jgi:hypothetical protein
LKEIDITGSQLLLRNMYLIWKSIPADNNTRKRLSFITGPVGLSETGRGKSPPTKRVSSPEVEQLETAARLGVVVNEGTSRTRNDTHVGGKEAPADPAARDAFTTLLINIKYRSHSK